MSRYAAQCAYVYWFISFFQNIKILLIIKPISIPRHLLLTWSSFVWCHVISSFSILDAYNENTVIPFRCALPMWIQRFREMLWMCEDGLCGHWYVLWLIATNTWCKIGHCSSVAVNPLPGVKSEHTVGYLANPPFWTISIFSTSKWGPPLAKDHRLYTRMLINLFDSYPYMLWYR